MGRAVLDTVTRLVGRLRARQRPRLPERGPVRLNLGSSLLVADCWINIDGGLGGLFAGFPRPLLRLAYRRSGMGPHMSEDAFVDVLSHHRFVHHDLTYGIPFPDGCARRSSARAARRAAHRRRVHAVQRCRFREGRVPDLDVLGNREGSLVMEAARPVPPG